MRFFSAAVQRCVISLSCYNDFIICCCLGNRHICFATQSPAMHRCFCAHVCTGEHVCSAQCVVQQKENPTLINDKGTRKGPVTQIWHNKTQWEGCVLDIHAGEDVWHFFSIYILLPAAADEICLQKHTSLISQKQQRSVSQCTNRDTVNLPKCKSDVGQLTRNL